MRKIFIFLLPFVLAAYSCNNATPPKNNVDSTEKIPAAQSDFGSDWHSLTESWAKALDMKKASVMKSFYADTVMYYGDKISGDDVVKRQEAYFEAHPDYKMRLTEFVGEEQQPDGNWKVRIIKAVTINGQTVNYPASLIYAKRNGIWKIISESDDITDLRKAQGVEVSYAPAIVTLEGLVEENTGFGTNVSGGDPKSDNKETYDVIWPSQPLNVIAASSQDGNVTENNIDRLQLIGNDKMIQPFLNKKVRVRGTLQHGDHVKHFTRVVMNVTNMEALK
jgi:hypothetical protein